jgi:hypothetical protein
MKRTTIALLIVVLGFSFATVMDADAGWFGKDKKEEAKYVPRYDRYPTMGFQKGVLMRDARTGWRLGELNIQFMEDCQVSTDGAEEGYLQEGRTAVITGPRWGNTVVAWRVRVLAMDQTYNTFDSNVVLEEGATPNVSVGHAPE